MVFADEVGAQDVAVNLYSPGRDVSRFYARLGFGSMVVRRTASLATLRRKLSMDPRVDIRDTAEMTPIQRSQRRRAILTPRRTVRP